MAHTYTVLLPASRSTAAAVYCVATLTWAVWWVAGAPCVVMLSLVVDGGGQASGVVGCRQCPETPRFVKRTAPTVLIL